MSNPSASSAEPPAARGALLYEEDPLVPNAVWAILAVVCIAAFVLGILYSRVAMLVAGFVFIVFVFGRFEMRNAKLRLFETALVTEGRSIALAELDPSFPLQRATELFDDKTLQDLKDSSKAELKEASFEEPNLIPLETRYGDYVDYIGPGALMVDFSPLPDAVNQTRSC